MKDVVKSTANIPEVWEKSKQNQDSNEMRFDVLSHVLARRNNQNFRLLSYTDLPKLKKVVNKHKKKQKVM